MRTVQISAWKGLHVPRIQRPPPALPFQSIVSLIPQAINLPSINFMFVTLELDGSSSWKEMKCGFQIKSSNLQITFSIFFTTKLGFSLSKSIVRMELPILSSRFHKTHPTTNSPSHHPHPSPSTLQPPCHIPATQPSSSPAHPHTPTLPLYTSKTTLASEYPSDESTTDLGLRRTAPSSSLSAGMMVWWCRSGHSRCGSGLVMCSLGWYSEKRGSLLLRLQSAVKMPTALFLIYRCYKKFNGAYSHS